MITDDAMIQVLDTILNDNTSASVVRALVACASMRATEAFESKAPGARIELDREKQLIRALNKCAQQCEKIENAN